ncbi:hypothetical protein [Citrobacter farmeri]|uniref:hypothetical protein n=1 Tax=Citrobacter farmeri TaxID=67824 RepID=UPI00189EC281|nr:hypothetical protein [Citrobacter farmeri]EHK0944366.1 hypothetical protein [Citrobacter farmeri]EKX4539723.1 hypothetical protein [Citrobacter farmeri]MDB2162737.1 hypothetical protein [Citrobacter farmeri]HBC0358176.1 hypothetical protein [Citrobacter farmeri]HBZ8835556.1 hypothetical protein [Citrobacter farmeri]
MKALSVKKTVYVLVIASVLSGCVSEEERLARCEAKGVSRDVCYQVDRANQQMINNNAQQNAYANARTAVKQHGQSTKKKIVYYYEGMEIKKVSTGLNINGLPATIVEKEESATVYQQGLHYFIVYSTGRLAVLNDQRQMLGWAK